MQSTQHEEERKVRFAVQQVNGHSSADRFGVTSIIANAPHHVDSVETQLYRSCGFAAQAVNNCTETIGIL